MRTSAVLECTGIPHAAVGLIAALDVVSAINGSLTIDYVRDGAIGTCALQ